MKRFCMHALNLWLVATLVAIGTMSAAAAEMTSHIGAIREGEAIFWDGPFIESAGIPSPIEPVVCHGATSTTIGCLYASAPPAMVPVCLPDMCLEYTLDVPESQGTLRVALDHPTTDNRFTVVLVDPMGVPSTWAFNIVTLSVEGRVPHAAAGRWTIQVLLHSVSQSGFRMRAYLEPPTVPPSDVIALPPNLQPSAPFDLTFDGCQLYETVRHSPQKCLRFSTGPNNLGGPLDIRIREFGLTGPEVQRIYNSDGTFTERPAGTFEYHAEHGHYHHVGTAGYQLYRVTDPSTGAMEKVGTGPKVGFCLGDTVIADWNSFVQEPQNGRNNECNGRIVGPPIPQVFEPVLDFPMFSLSAGWGDLYTYPIEGNYVDFGGNGAGSYVIQVAADPDNTILESHEADNVAYTYFSVAGDEIVVIERGLGASPWDPASTIVNDGRREVAS